MKNNRKNHCIPTVMPAVLRIKNVFLTAFVMIFLFTTYPLKAAESGVPAEEFKKLYDSGKYSIILEKALNILHTREKKLTSKDVTTLYYYIGMAYKKDQNNEMAADYLKKIELKDPTSEYLKQAYIELADIYKNDYFQREGYLAKLIGQFPKTPEAINAAIQLSKEYVRLKSYKKAIPFLESITNVWNMGDSTPEVYVLMAMAYFGAERYIEAADALTKAEKSPEIIKKDPFYLFEAGRISFHSLKYKNSIQYLEQLFNIYPTYQNIPEAAIILAQCHEKEGNPFFSAVFLIKALMKKPETKQQHSLYLNLGRVLNNLSNNDYLRIKQLYPLYTNAEKFLNTVKSESINFEERKMAAILLSDSYKKNNKMAKSVDNFHKFLNENRDAAVEKLFKENLDAYLAELENNNKLEELFNSWVKLKDRKSFLSPDNLMKFGAVMFRMKLYAHAEEIYRHILKYKMYGDKWGEANTQLVRILYNVGRYQECIDAMLKINGAEDPLLSEFKYYKIMSYGYLKKYDQSDTILETSAVEIETIANDFQFRILDLKLQRLDKLKKYDEALELSQKMSAYPAITPENRFKLILVTGDLYFKKNDMEKSLMYYNNALGMGNLLSSNNREWVLYRIATIYREVGKPDDAKPYWNQLKKFNPKSFWLKQLEKNVR